LQQREAAQRPAHLGLPGRDDEALVVSTIFRTQDGTFQIDCDLMCENGQVLCDLEHIEVGAIPMESEIEAAVDTVIAFANQLERTIVEFLRTQGTLTAT
jgi:hypothetical protein